MEYSLVLLNIMAGIGQGVEYVISRDMNVRLLLEILYTEVFFASLSIKIASGFIINAAYTRSC